MYTYIYIYSSSLFFIHIYTYILTPIDCDAVVAAAQLVAPVWAVGVDVALLVCHDARLGLVATKKSVDSRRSLAGKGATLDGRI